jgi:nitrogen permease regulator 3-like protein
MKTLYSAIKSRSMAYLSIHALPLELQLPPHLDNLLHSTGGTDPDDDDLQLDLFNFTNPSVDRDDDYQAWGPDFDVGWRVPALTPWKSLLLLDEQQEGFDPYTSLKGPHVSSEDRTLVEGLMRFLEHASITLS